MRAVFITGTDTEVGKTVVTGLLGRFILNQGYRVITQKWLATGRRKFSSDIDSHLKLMKMNLNYIKDYLPFILPYNFKFAASPHLAAKLEGKTISSAKIEKSFEFLKKKFDFVIVEGTGGILVPYSKKKLMIDIARKLSLPVLVVVENKLGGINHTLLTIEALKKRKMKIVGMIFNERGRKTNNIILKDNIETIKQLTGERVLGSLAYCKDEKRLYRAFIPTGKRILTAIFQMQKAKLQAQSA